MRVQRVGVLVVTDGAVPIAGRYVVGDVDRAVLRLRVPPVGRVELGLRARQLDARVHLLAERVPRALVKVCHPAREEVRGARAVGADHRRDRQVRELSTVDLGDPRIVPVGDRPGEDPYEDRRRQPQVGDQMPVLHDVVHERRAARGVRDVGITPGDDLPAGVAELVVAVAERRVRAGEVVLVLDVPDAAGRRPDRAVVGHKPLGPEVRRPLVDGYRGPGRARAADRCVVSRIGRWRRRSQPERGQPQRCDHPGGRPPEDTQHARHGFLLRRKCLGLERARTSAGLERARASTARLRVLAARLARRHRPAMPPSAASASEDEPPRAASAPRISSAGRMKRVSGGGPGCAATRVTGWLPAGLVVGDFAGELGAELEPGEGLPELPGWGVPPLPWWPPWPPWPPPLLCPVWFATSTASLRVSARIDAGSGMYPAGSLPGRSPGDWPAPTAKSRKRAMAAALACDSPLVGTIA